MVVCNLRPVQSPTRVERLITKLPHNLESKVNISCVCILISTHHNQVIVQVYNNFKLPSNKFLRERLVLFGLKQPSK